MLSKFNLTGRYMPYKVLCLTFDDGPGKSVTEMPGPKSLFISKYLFENSIAATFFVTGKNALQYPDVLSNIISHNHIVANHTFSHPVMTRLFSTGEDFLKEIEDTELAILPYISGKNIYFRSPYGNWKPEMSVKFNANNKCTLNYIGPCYYDIDGSDWLYWQKQKTAKECADNYLKLIKEKGSGIILMHDSSADDEQIKDNNLTYEALKIMIPALINDGYKFVNLPEALSLSNSFLNKLKYHFRKVFK